MSINDEFKPPTNKDIMEIINIMNESDFDELRLELDDFKLFLSKHVADSPQEIPGPGDPGVLQPEKRPSQRRF